MVTGASQGVGAATARACAAAGATVVLVARGAQALEALAAEIGAAADPRPCDVTDPEAVAALFAHVAAAHGRLDAVFNNAGLSAPGTEFGDVTWADWRRVMAVNVDGAFLIARGAYAMMRDQRPQGGRIVNNGSVSAHAPRPGSAAYTASKHAITGLTKAVALDGRACDVACCQIDIGNAATPMTAAMPKGVPQADGSVRAEPVMDVAHVADTVVRMMALPLDVNMQTVTIMATKMPYVGRG